MSMDTREICPTCAERHVGTSRFPHTTKETWNCRQCGAALTSIYSADAVEVRLATEVEVMQKKITEYQRWAAIRWQTHSENLATYPVAEYHARERLLVLERMDAMTNRHPHFRVTAHVVWDLRMETWMCDIRVVRPRGMPIVALTVMAATSPLNAICQAEALVDAYISGVQLVGDPLKTVNQPILLNKRCPACDGHGRFKLGEEMMSCPTCNGVGQVPGDHQ